LSDDIKDLLTKYNELKEQLQLHYGKLESLVEEKLINEQMDKENPLFVSPASLIHQYINNQAPLTKKTAVLGIIYSSKNHLYQEVLTLLLMEKEELFQTPTVLFTIDDLNVEENLISGHYVYQGKLEPCVTNIPPIIYNTALFSMPKSLRTLRQIRMNSSLHVINAINWFHQDVLFEMLSLFHQSEDFLLPHKHLNQSNLQHYLQTYDEFYLIPRRHYSHPRVVTIHKLNSQNVKISYGSYQQIVPLESLYFVLYKMLKSEKYLLVKGVPDVFKWNQLPGEGRFYVQKDKSGKWKVIARLFKNQMFANNSLYDLDVGDIDSTITSEIPVSKSMELNRLPVQIATYFDFLLPNVGSFYFDFLITQDGNMYLIHIGGVEQHDFLKRFNQNLFHQYTTNMLDYLIYELSNKRTRLDDHDNNLG
jgi:hypothetical protein